MSTPARRSEARTLARIGEVFLDANLPPVTVRVPRVLADEALAAWHRDDSDPVPVTEGRPDRRARHHAGALALIGLAISERGRGEGDDVVVDLAPDLVGRAIDAAD